LSRVLNETHDGPPTRPAPRLRASGVSHPPKAVAFRMSPIRQARSSRAVALKEGPTRFRFRERRIYHFELLMPMSPSALGFSRPRISWSAERLQPGGNLRCAGWSIEHVRAMVI